jgi:uncharacterized spore protein YtfJ
MALTDLITRASDCLSVSRVYSEPCTMDGVTVIPAAVIIGGGGGGGGKQTDGHEGEGGGFGVIARPVGAYVIKNGEVRWVPAIDLNRALMITAGAMWLLRRRQAKRRRTG